MPGNIQDVPLEVLKSWSEPNYDDPVRRSWLPAFAMVWQIVSTLLVWARFWLHARRLAGSFGLDDVFLFVAWAVSVPFTACAWIDVAWYGLDRHTWDVRLSQFTGAALIGWVAQVLMLVSTGATKASVILFYRRMVFDTLARRWKVAIYFALIFHACYFLGVLLALLLVCRPLEAYWMSYDFHWEKDYECSPANALNPVIGVLSVVSDLYAVALPCAMLQHYNLGVTRRQKIGLNLIFATGTLVAGAGIARTYFLIKLGNIYDTSWTGFNLYTWSIIECQLALICASAPSLRALFRRYLSESISRSFRSSHSHSPGGTKISTVQNERQRTSRLHVSEDPDGELVHLQPLAKSSLDTAGRTEGYAQARSSVSKSATGDGKKASAQWERRSSRSWFAPQDGAGWKGVQEIHSTV